MSTANAPSQTNRSPAIEPIEFFVEDRDKVRLLRENLRHIQELFTVSCCVSQSKQGNGEWVIINGADIDQAKKAKVRCLFSWVGFMPVVCL